MHSDSIGHPVREAGAGDTIILQGSPCGGASPAATPEGLTDDDIRVMCEDIERNLTDLAAECQRRRSELPGDVVVKCNHLYQGTLQAWTVNAGHSDHFWTGDGRTLLRALENLRKVCP